MSFIPFPVSTQSFSKGKRRHHTAIGNTTLTQRGSVCPSILLFCSGITKAGGSIVQDEIVTFVLEFPHAGGFVPYCSSRITPSRGSLEGWGAKRMEELAHSLDPSKHPLRPCRASLLRVSAAQLGLEQPSGGCRSRTTSTEFTQLHKPARLFDPPKAGAGVIKAWQGQAASPCRR